MNGETDVLARYASGALERALRAFSIVVVTGARQTGKSTLVQTLGALSEHAYFRLDDLDVREQARIDPAGLVRRAPRLVLDEVQRVPDLLLAIKRAVDEGREPGRFILTGSANLLLMKEVSESLAGRAVYLDLWPLTRGELEGHGRAGRWSSLFELPFGSWPDALDGLPAPEGWRERARVGGYPVPAHVLDDADARGLWFRGYTQTYLERDLQELSSIGNLSDFRRLMRGAALRVGGLENQSDIARDAAVAQSTAHRSLALLETSYQLVRLAPYAVNRTKRLVKSPRLFWSDPGLALHLADAAPEGAHLENLVLADLLAWRDAQLRPPRVLYWRTRSGEEVDFVIEWRDELVPVEVKATERPRFDDTRHLRSFREEYGAAVRGGLLLHDGDTVERLTESVWAVPWWRVL